MSFYSPILPLKRGDKDTYETYKTIKEQINFYLKNLLLTFPGENISDPSYGVGLHSFLFEPSAFSTYSNVISEISSQISRYIPYIVVSNISVDEDPSSIDSNLLNIKIVYNIIEDPEVMLFELDVNTDTTIGLY